MNECFQLLNIRATKVPSIYGFTSNDKCEWNKKKIAAITKKNHHSTRIISLCHDYYSLRSRTPISPYHRFLFERANAYAEISHLPFGQITTICFSTATAFTAAAVVLSLMSKTYFNFRSLIANCTKNRDYVKRRVAAKKKTSTYNYELEATLIIFQ